MIKKTVRVLIIIAVLIPFFGDSTALSAANSYGEVSWRPTLWELSWVLWALLAIFAVRKKRYHRDASLHCHEHLYSDRHWHL